MRLMGDDKVSFAKTRTFLPSFSFCRDQRRAPFEARSLATIEIRTNEKIPR